MRFVPRNLATGILRYFFLGLLSLSLALLVGQVALHQPAKAQNLRVEQAATLVYQRFPYLPQENQYIRRETNEVDESFTLINRFIRYHIDVKKRSPRSRLDWKLTFADYLGMNEAIKLDRYPGSSTLESNPMESDRQAIANLSRRQRNEVVGLLASLYTPVSETTAESEGKPAQEPTPAATPKKPNLSQPGDAQLLMP